MALIGVQNLTHAFGARPLLENASLQIERGERIGLLGRNGEGKSTFLRVLAGLLRPDQGEVTRAAHLRTAWLPQEVPTDLAGPVSEWIGSGFRPGRRAEHEIDRLCAVLELDPDQDCARLSGGQKRRALLGKALAGEPDALLLDEPTNHLDLAGIQWLEQFLLRFPACVVFVTHDRAFLQKVATRIVELDRGRLSSWNCDYATFLRRKEEWLAAEEERWALQDKRLAQEEVWIRQGVKARRTRAEGRVKRLLELRRARAERRDRVGQVRLSIQTAERSGEKVIEATEVDFTRTAPDGSERWIVRGFSTRVDRGDKIGIIGPNGCGKTTLLNLLLGRLAPQRGAIEHGTRLEIAVFDQLRARLDPEATVIQNLAEGRESVRIDGRERHVLGYLQDFLFAPERARLPVRLLSGGERNRLLLARLFLQPSNLLVLDEPTNDLDTETLELLETRLVEYPGTVLVVSHDRAFLDNLCSETLVFEGDGVINGYVGGYSDWQNEVRRRAAPPPAAPAPTAAPARPVVRGAPLNNKERAEWEGIPARIEALEAELAALQARLADPAVYAQGPAEAQAISARLEALPAAMDRLYARWESLGERASLERR
jgi:ATP-binding cassette subfamily F protein uup